MYSLAAISIPSRSFLSKSIETTIFKEILIWDLAQEECKVRFFGAQE